MNRAPLPITRAVAPATGPISFPQQSTNRAYVLCVLLAVMVFGAYARTLKNPFVNFDDQGYVVENQHVRQGVTLDTLRWSLTSTDADNWHPLTWLSHALDCQLFGLNPAGHHSTNLLLHVANCVLIFLLLFRATGALARSFLVAAIFGVHPINVESVAWIAERKNVLSMLFFLLALGAYGWYAKRPTVPRYASVAVLFALGLAAKPMIVTLPFVLLLVDFWPLQRVTGLPESTAFPVPQRGFSHLALEKVPLLALSVASSIVTVIAQRGAIADNALLPLSFRVLNALHAYAVYLWKAIWPAHLAAFYPYTGYRLTDWQLWLAAAVLSAASFYFWRERKHLYLPVGWCWFLGAMVPVIGLVQVGEQSLADRYAYLPLLGLFWIVIWGASDLMESRGVPGQIKSAIAAAVLVALAVLTWWQTGVWHSSYELWAHAIQVTRNNFWAEDYVGSALLVDAYETSGQRYSEEAIVHFQNAIRINPQDPIGHLNVGAYLHERGELAAAIREYQTVLALTNDPHLRTKATIDLGAANQQLGKYAAAREYYAQALTLDPTNRAVFLSMGRLGMEERIHELAAAASQKPSSDAYFELGQLQRAAGHVPEARTSFQTALKLDPAFVDAKNALDGLERNPAR